MINDEYGFDLNSAQARDNLNYEIQSGIRRKKNFNAIEKVEKGPKDISHYMKSRQPTQGIKAKVKLHFFINLVMQYQEVRTS